MVSIFTFARAYVDIYEESCTQAAPGGIDKAVNGFCTTKVCS